MSDGVKPETQKFEVQPKAGPRPYQKRRNKNSSGDCAWHSRTPYLRKLGRAIYEWTGVEKKA